jgi:hypothetical protein
MGMGTTSPLFTIRIASPSSAPLLRLPFDDSEVLEANAVRRPLSHERSYRLSTPSVVAILAKVMVLAVGRVGKRVPKAVGWIKRSIFVGVEEPYSDRKRFGVRIAGLGGLRLI